ncbi:MAG: hypothetical protein QXG39_04810 [Candidatus Aenigmatarchaeota archaeon]
MKMKVEYIIAKNGNVEHLIQATEPNEFNNFLLFNLELTLKDFERKREVMKMVKLKEILKESKTGIFEGERAKLRDFTDKTISITKVSDVLTGDYGDYRVIQFQHNRKNYTAVINSKTVVYKKLDLIAKALENEKSVEATVKQIQSKKSKRKYLDLV